MSLYIGVRLVDILKAETFNQIPSCGALSLLNQNDSTVSYSPCLGTIRYIGKLMDDQLQKIWIGIEWDSPDRGKHDGCVHSERYFDCHRAYYQKKGNTKVKLTEPKHFSKVEEDGKEADIYSDILTSASFIPSDVINIDQQLGMDFESALLRRYCTKLTEEETQSLRIGDGNSKQVEIVGVQKIENYYKDLNNLDSVDLDGYYVYGIEKRHCSHAESRKTERSISETTSFGTSDIQIPKSFPRVRFLCLRRHLISTFSEVIQFLVKFPNLEVLVLSNSKFPRRGLRKLDRCNHQCYESNTNSSPITNLLLDKLSCRYCYKIEPWEGLEESSTSHFVHTILKELNLRSSGVEWIDLQLVLRIFPKLQNLDISFSPQLFDLISHQLTSTSCQFSESKVASLNNLSQTNSLLSTSSREDGCILNLPGLFSCLTSIIVHQSTIRSWRSLFSLYQLFPYLTRVAADSNQLDDDTIEELLPFKDHPATERVQDLGLDDNLIHHWRTIGVLAALFRKLHSFRWFNNPLQQAGISILRKSSSHLPNLQTLKEVQHDSMDHAQQRLKSSLTGQQLSRQIVIALLPELINLNGCEIQAAERKHAERYFLSLSARRSPVIEEADPDHEHTKRLELIHKTGFFEPSYEHTTNNSLALKQDDAPFEVLLQPACLKAFDKPPVTQKLPSWLKVGDLKSMCQRLFNLVTSKQRLLLCAPDMPVPIELSEDGFPLSFYGFEKGCKILVGDVSCAS